MRVDWHAMKRLAHEIAHNLRIGDVVFLRGPLGVGKTTFTRMIVNAMLQLQSVDAVESKSYIDVASPTFSILHQYELQGNAMNVIVWHFDLYRIKSPEELEHLGIEEAVYSGISIVEWPEVIPQYQYWEKDAIINVNIDFTDNVDLITHNNITKNICDKYYNEREMRDIFVENAKLRNRV